MSDAREAAVGVVVDALGDWDPIVRLTMSGDEIDRGAVEVIAALLDGPDLLMVLAAGHRAVVDENERLRAEVVTAGVLVQKVRDLLATHIDFGHLTSAGAAFLGQFTLTVIQLCGRVEALAVSSDPRLAPGSIPEGGE